MRVNFLEVRTVVWLLGREFDLPRSGDGCYQGLRVGQGMDRITRLLSSFCSALSGDGFSFRHVTASW